jgi:23S rRNA (uracil1939-C5)-methyltransferase
MARDHAVVDVPECRILQPEIVAALPMLQRLSRRLGGNGKTIRLTVLSTLTSLDVTVEGEKLPLTLSTNAELAELANEACWARLTVGGREIVTRNRPELEIGGVRVIPPPGAFVQAVAEAEAIMQDCVVAALGRSRNVADLYAGLGTLTFPIARTAQVLAVDSDAAALAALEQAERHARGLKPIVTRRRDLLREPLARKELEPFDCVVFDPPRAGAKAQAEMLAGSQVPLVVAVSCSPATLARDLAILQDGGFVIERVTPIDQFVFTSHVEAVAIARRPGRRRRG